MDLVLLEPPVQPGQGAVERLAAPRHLDLLARLLQRLQTQHVAQEEAERTGDVVLQRRRAEDTLRPEQLRQFADHRRVAKQAVVGIVRCGRGNGARIRRAASARLAVSRPAAGLVRDSGPHRATLDAILRR